MNILLNRLDWTFPEPAQCQWCGEANFEKLRFSIRFGNDPRIILFCTSCRAREADGQLDEYGKLLFKTN